MTGFGAEVKRRGPGRPRSIPPELFETVLQLYKGGLGYRSIANHLRGLGVGTTHTAVRGMIKGEGRTLGRSNWSYTRHNRYLLFEFDAGDFALYQ